MEHHCLIDLFRLSLTERQRNCPFVPLAALQIEPVKASQADRGLRAWQALQQGGHHREASERQERG